MTASDQVKLKPGDTIGILGGGQLGRMLAMAAARLGLRCQVFSPDPDSPAFDVVLNATCAEYADVEALELFANDVDVITYEFENVPAADRAWCWPRAVRCCPPRRSWRPRRTGWSKRTSSSGSASAPPTMPTCRRRQACARRSRASACPP